MILVTDKHLLTIKYLYIWRRKWQPTPVFLPGEFHGQRSLPGYSSWGCKELDMTERLNRKKDSQGETTHVNHDKYHKLKRIHKEECFSSWLDVMNDNCDNNLFGEESHTLKTHISHPLHRRDDSAYLPSPPQQPVVSHWPLPEGRSFQARCNQGLSLLKKS